MLTGLLLRVLRDRGRPMFTDELADLMPWKPERMSQGGCEWWCESVLPASVRMLECHGSWHLIAYRRRPQGFSGIYRHLRALERRGLVRRVHRDGTRRVYWSARGDEDRNRGAEDDPWPTRPQ
jgi:hypothetical protein